MIKAENYKSDILYEEKQKEENKFKLYELQKEFIKFENGELTSDKLISKLNEEYKIKNNELDQFLKNPGLDNKNFRKFLKNFSFLREFNTEYRNANSKLEKFNYNKKEEIEFRKKLKQSIWFILKFLDIIESKQGHIFPFEDKQDEKNVELKKLCKNFTKSEINLEEFKKKLIEQNIDVHNEYIVNAINKAERGVKDSFKVLYATISLNKKM